MTAWLALLAHQLEGVVAGVVLRADGAQRTFNTVAVVPDPRRDVSHLRGAAEQAVAECRGTIVAGDAGATVHIGYPVEAAGEIGFVVALDVTARSEPALQEALRLVHWSSAWLAKRLWELRAHAADRRLERAAVALDTLAVAEEHAAPAPAAMAVVNTLADKLGCDRVAIGSVVHRRSGARVRLLAVSHSAWFRRRSSFVDGLENAMDEAFDQNASVTVPRIGDGRSINVAHRDYAKLGGARDVVSVVLADRGAPAGVLTLERRHGEPLDAETMRVAEAVADLLGPVLELKRRNRRWLGGRLVDGASHVLGVLFGPRRLSWKLLAIALVASTAAALLVEGTFRINADAVVEAASQRAVVAPFDGFVAEAAVRPGDPVRVGETLVRLDDRDLRLEALHAASERERLRSQQRDALAAHDRAEVALLGAQIRQAEAQLALAEAKLERARLDAPFEGLVVAGDLSQKLGAPVRQGDVLFEIAPRDSFRVVFFVDERDLRWIASGQSARLVLSGMPDSGLDVTVRAITPVAQAREGRNTFRVEGDLERANGPLRPGMEGVGKIAVDERPYAWIWTRRLGDWLRETTWTWRP